MRAKLISVLVIALLCVPAIAGAGASDERTLTRLTNGERGSRGLGALTVRSDLAALARRHARRMAEAGSIWHDPGLSDQVDGWTRWGSNVGKGPDAEHVHDGFMESAHHRANILGRFNEVGMGTARGGDGALYVAQVFVQRGSRAASSRTRTVEAPVVRRAAPASRVPRAAPRARPPALPTRTVDVLVALTRLDGR